MTQLYIKNMVCNRCIYVVTQLFREEGLPPLAVRMGEVELEKVPDTAQRARLESKLGGLGFEILGDQKSRLIEKIKLTIIGHIQADEAGGQGHNPVFSELLATGLHKDYSYLSKLFSEVEGITIEKYIIEQKVEKIKEWLVYDELNITEIADRLGYSSVAHLSAQFKKVTGMTPSMFRKLQHPQRKSLDELGAKR